MMAFTETTEVERRLANLEEAVKYLPEYIKRQNELEMRMDSLEKLLNKAVVGMMPKLDEVLIKLKKEPESVNRIDSSVRLIPSSATDPSSDRNIDVTRTNSNTMGDDSSRPNISATIAYPVIYPPKNIRSSHITTDTSVNYVSTNYSSPTAMSQGSGNLPISESPLYVTMKPVPRIQVSGDPSDTVSCVTIPETSQPHDISSNITNLPPESNALWEIPTVDVLQSPISSLNIEASSDENAPTSVATPISPFEESSSSITSQSVNIVPASSRDTFESSNVESLNYATIMFTNGNSVGVNAIPSPVAINSPDSSQASTDITSASIETARHVNEVNESPTTDGPSTPAPFHGVRLRYPFIPGSIPYTRMPHIPFASRTSLPSSSPSTLTRSSLPSQPFLPTAPSNLSLLPAAENGQPLQQPLTPLLAAAERGDASVLRRMLSSQSSRIASVEERDAHGDTALHLAAAAGHVDALLVLLAAWANSNARGRRLRTPLHCAAAGGHAPAVRRLLRAGANPSLEDADGATALALAATQGHVDAFSTLLNKGATASARDKRGYTPAVRAASHGHGEVVVTLLQSGGVDPDESDAQGHPLIVHAARGKHWDVVRLLMQNGASSTASKSPEESALALATKDGQIDIVREILQQGASAEAAQVRKALAVAKTPAVVWAFVDAAPDALRGDAGRLALLSAAVDGRLEVLSALLEAGVDIGGTAEEGGEAQVEALLALLAADENTLRRKAKKGILKGIFRKHSSKHAKRWFLGKTEIV